MYIVLHPTYTPTYTSRYELLLLIVYRVQFIQKVTRYLWTFIIQFKNNSFFFLGLLHL